MAKPTSTSSSALGVWWMPKAKDMPSSHPRFTVKTPTTITVRTHSRAYRSLSRRRRIASISKSRNISAPTATQTSILR